MFSSNGSCELVILDLFEDVSCRNIIEKELTRVFGQKLSTFCEKINII